MSTEAPSDLLAPNEETVISPLQQYAAYPFDLDETYQVGGVQSERCFHITY
jgi:hypothetical protein